MTAATQYTRPEPTRRTLYWRFNRLLERYLPSGLYRRTLIIVIAPMVVMQSIMAFIFMERHWDQVTKALSRSVARDMAFVIEMYDGSDKSPKALEMLQLKANQALHIGLNIETDSKLPAPVPKPLFSLLDQQLTKYIVRFVGRPFWLDTIGKSGYVDVRIQVDQGVIFRFLTNQDRAYASNTHIFLLWMLGSSLVLLAVAVIFMRNQIRPILQLADAAQKFGMGREVENFYPRGASEVRDAALAFIHMKRRIERHIEQRTTMLAGVSHDLRTVLTRFKLELAMMGDDPRVEEMKGDVGEMQAMLEGYMAFVRGDDGESAQPTDIVVLIEDIKRTLARSGRAIKIESPDDLIAPVKPDAFRRCLSNLVHNAVRYADNVEVTARLDGSYLFVTVADDGPGIPASRREEVFKPFVRLDDARNQDAGGTGLGLAIARDIVQSHGGDIRLGESERGGLEAEVRIPV